MNITQKSDLEKVVAFLKSASEQEQDYRLRASLVNVACVLEQSLECHCEDEQHPHLYLEIKKAPNLLDSAMDNCCTTECVHVCQGTCPFLTTEKKHHCPRIAQYLESDI